MDPTMMLLMQSLGLGSSASTTASTNPLSSLLGLSSSSSSSARRGNVSGDATNNVFNTIENTNVWGNDGDDTFNFQGNNVSNYGSGGNGNDTATMKGSNSTHQFDGGAGNDTINANDNKNTFFINGGEGDDIVNVTNTGSSASGLSGLLSNPILRLIFDLLLPGLLPKEPPKQNSILDGGNGTDTLNLNGSGWSVSSTMVSGMRRFENSSTGQVYFVKNFETVKDSTGHTY
jgi:Ca2+-binding RTX toxin-like protein